MLCLPQFIVIEYISRQIICRRVTKYLSFWLYDIICVKICRKITTIFYSVRRAQVCP